MHAQECPELVKYLLATTRQQWGLPPDLAATSFPWPRSRKLMRSRMVLHSGASDGLRASTVTHLEWLPSI